MRKTRRTAPPVQKTGLNYRQLWRIVDGAVADAFRMHPDYLNPARLEKVTRASVNKRVVGAILGFAEQARGRPGTDG